MSKMNWEKAARRDRQDRYGSVPWNSTAPATQRPPVYENGYRRLVLRYPARCYVCQTLVRDGSVAYWRPDNHAVRCSKHAPPTA